MKCHFAAIACLAASLMLLGGCGTTGGGPGNETGASEPQENITGGAQNYTSDTTNENASDVGAANMSRDRQGNATGSTGTGGSSGETGTTGPSGTSGTGSGSY